MNTLLLVISTPNKPAKLLFVPSTIHIDAKGPEKVALSAINTTFGVGIGDLTRTASSSVAILAARLKSMPPFQGERSGHAGRAPEAEAASGGFCQD